MRCSDAGCGACLLGASNTSITIERDKLSMLPFVCSRSYGEILCESGVIWLSHLSPLDV